MDLDLSTGIPPSPERTLQLAGVLPEVVRTLNHATRDHEALHYPSDADRLIRALEMMASRLPQLIEQVDAWLEREDGAERIEIPSGEYEGNPLLATAAARMELDAARAAAADLRQSLASAASVTSGMAAREDDGDA